MNRKWSMRASGESDAFWLTLGGGLLTLTVTSFGLSLYWWSTAPSSPAIVSGLDDGDGESPPEQLEWETFSLPELGCAFTMPGIPVIRLIDEETPWGKTNWHLERLILDAVNWEWFTVAASRDFVALADDPLDRFVRMYVLNEMVVSEPTGAQRAGDRILHHRLGVGRTVKSIEYDDDGRGLLAVLEPRFPRGPSECIRVVVDNDRIFYVSVMGTGLSRNDEDVQRYLTGFRIHRESDTTASDSGSGPQSSDTSPSASRR